MIFSSEANVLSPQTGSGTQRGTEMTGGALMMVSVSSLGLGLSLLTDVELIGSSVSL